MKQLKHDCLKHLVPQDNSLQTWPFFHRVLSCIQPYHASHNAHVQSSVLMGCFEAVLPSMLERNTGHLVGVSSLAGYRGVPGAVAYCASKAALNNLMESLRVELYNTGVHATTICPGYVKTEMTSEVTTPMPFLLDCDDAAARIYRAIDRTKTEYAFPFPISGLMRFARFVPNAVYDRLVGYFSI